MDLIYKIYSVYLYGNQVDHDYLILNNRSKSFTGEVKWDLPYEHSIALQEIHLGNHLSDDSPVKLMENASKRMRIPFIKNDGFLSLVKTQGTHLPNYNVYEIYWNETKSGINIHDYEVCHVWNKGQSQYSSYRIWEEKSERDKQLRENKLHNILN
jgi:hypothetical protein